MSYTIRSTVMSAKPVEAPPITVSITAPESFFVAARDALLHLYYAAQAAAEDGRVEPDLSLYSNRALSRLDDILVSALTGPEYEDREITVMEPGDTGNAS